MNQEIRYLQEISWEEKLGFFLLQKGFKILFWVTGSVVLLLGLTFFVHLVKQNNASRLIDTAESTRTQTLNLLREKKDFLHERSSYFKEKDFYDRALDRQIHFYQALSADIEALQAEKSSDVIRKFKTGLLRKFQPNSKSQKLIQEIEQVFEAQNYLIENWTKLSAYREGLDSQWQNEEIKHQEIQDHSPYERVRQQGKKNFDRLDKSFGIFKNHYDQNQRFGRAEIGKYNFVQIQAFLKTLEDVKQKHADFVNFREALDRYYNLLQVQFYTKIIAQYTRSTLTYESEPNPAFREWTETETYSDTETYYESQSYSATCTETNYETRTTIVNGKAVTRSVPLSHSVPCTKTRQVSKTRPVTRTRSITKNNGEARYVDVPYTTFSFYYTRERVTPQGKTQSEQNSGSIKLKGSNPSEPDYTYKTDEQIGYVIWKEKWNDQEQKGLLNPHLK
ncbi:MAG: hypothetical protein NW226_11175 [Microscillaceae bacterium]|nr:hypothetical protein [Microscillaceae bacterium]